MMAAATTTSSALAALLICAAAFLATHATDDHHQKPEGDDLVVKVCANLTSHKCWPRLTREFCEPVLRSDNRSAAAKHPRDLALVAIDLLQRGAADADAKVDGAIRSGSGRHSNETALALQFCRLDYSYVARTVPVCRDMVQEYKDGHESDDEELFPVDYFNCADVLRQEAARCWRKILGDSELMKVVSKEVKEAFDRGCLVKSMIENMVGVGDDDDDMC